MVIGAVTKGSERFKQTYEMVKWLKCFQRFRVQNGARTFRKQFRSLLKYVPLVLPSSEGRGKLRTTRTTVWFTVEYCQLYFKCKLSTKVIGRAVTCDLPAFCLVSGEDWYPVALTGTTPSLPNLEPTTGQKNIPWLETVESALTITYERPHLWHNPLWLSPQ